jgi:hypothetical protein
MSLPPPDPIYFEDPSIPAIYGYVPYGKYTKDGEWKVTNPCQPSLIPMRSPQGQIFLTYEHPPDKPVKGKNQAQSLMSQMTGKAKALSGQVGRVGRAVGNVIGSLFH